MNSKRFALLSLIPLYFVICLEILIMISPFAGFFYSAFNPVLLQLAEHAATRWLTVFFLPHLAVPSTTFLVVLRVLGSWLFLGGMLVFFVCAAQIYTAKFRRRGAVLGGLYQYIRHPQYLGLAMAAAGLAILWPRMLVVLLWCLMVLLYYCLAKDEEKRMLRQYGETYRPYLEKTGMFLPRRLEKLLLPKSPAGRLLVWPLICLLAMGAAFGLRSYTIHHLVLRQAGEVTAFAILPEDGFKLDHRLAAVLDMESIRARLQAGQRYLVYFIPQNYIMQGLIADTGGDWRLYKHHHTLAMIGDFILHPFSHLRQGHHAMHHTEMQNNGTAAAGGLVRRLIFIRIEGAPGNDPASCFVIDASRRPDFMADVDIHNLKLLDMKELPKTTGWGYVPTPTF